MKGERMLAHTGSHILLVEDDHDLRELLWWMFSLQGYRITAVTNGDQALAFVQDDLSIDVLITDYHLPDCTGVDIILRLQSLPRHISSILMSVQPNVAQLAQQCGADASFLKTDPLSELPMMLAVLLGESTSAALKGDGGREKSGR